MFNLDGWGNNECLNNRKKAEATQNKTKAINQSTKQVEVRMGKMGITR
ncbi:hypothetical protein ACIGEH_05860 [Bacillus altitudinis]|nr:MULTISPECIES: hypothetical protein [Bacillus]